MPVPHRAELERVGRNDPLVHGMLAVIDGGDDPADALARAVLALSTTCDNYRRRVIEVLANLPTPAAAPGDAMVAHLFVAEVGHFVDLLLRVRRGSCWCDVAINHPMVRDHSSTCRDIRLALGIKS